MEEQVVHGAIRELLDEVPVSLEFHQLLQQALVPRDSDSFWAPLPLLCCLAAGGQQEVGKLLSAIFLIGRTAASILDDVQDDDSDKVLWRAVGAAQATNVGVALIFAAQVAFERLLAQGAPLSTVLEQAVQ